MILYSSSSYRTTHSYTSSNMIVFFICCHTIVEIYSYISHKYLCSPIIWPAYLSNRVPEIYLRILSTTTQRVQVPMYKILGPQSTHIDSTFRPKYIIQEHLDPLGYSGLYIDSPSGSEGSELPSTPNRAQTKRESKDHMG